jgi:hypothetical protein
MAEKNTKMGYEGAFYYGPAGAVATNQLVNITDKNYDIGKETGDTTVAGDGESVPIGTARVVKLTVSIGWTMLQKDDDTTLAALQAAATTGAPVAFRSKSSKTGKGYDGDVILDAKQGMPQGDKQTIQFTAEPTDQAGRIPKLLV